MKKEKLKSPILDCLTRWHSTMEMLERLLYLKPFILNMSANDSKLKKLCMSNDEWKKIDALCKSLLPAKVCTKVLQSEQLTLTDFYGAWLQCKIQTESLNTSFSRNVFRCLVSREHNIMSNKVLLSAIFLDPRFKITLTKPQSSVAINHLINVWTHLKKLKEREIEFEKNSLNNSVTEDPNANFHLTTSEDELEFFLQQKDQSISSTSSQVSQILRLIQS